jgi:aminoglycoside phosphotransferase (APT) family kinase protein
VASTITNALHLLGDIGIPYTLGHGDFNPGNILVEGDRCVFIDWAEAHVGHPFLTFEYLLAHLRMVRPTLTMREDSLREAYTACWQSTLCSADIERGLQLSPLIAVYASAISSNSWRDPERLAVPQVPGYLRSLTRRMSQESGKLHQRQDLHGSRSQSFAV